MRAQLVSRAGLFVVTTLCVALAGCASSPAESGGPERPGSVTARDVGGGGRDLGGGDEDTGTSVEDTGPEDSGSVSDVVFLDTGGTTEPEDTGTTDTEADAPSEDAGPCSGQGCACTASNRSFVCGSLPCVDGYCCDSSCNDTCSGCDVAGSEGTCSFYPAGVDPKSDCNPQSPDTCGRTGECDGAGACQLYGDETSCNDGEACSVGDACDGAGSCRGEVPSTCGPGAGNECCVGTCSDGAGCATAAGSCADVCTASSLTIGRSCAGCGAAGASGVCGGGGSHRCDAEEHSPCQELTCGGVRYYCTNAGGSWAWRAGGACDDGNACTYDDRCGGGSCGGTTVTCNDTTCADRECNGTATCDVTPHPGRNCDDGNACTYNDTCSGAGVCEGGGSVTCTDSPCIDRACTGGPTCSETILTGSDCSDGNACSYGDRCSASGTCEPVGTADCPSKATACMSSTCNGTSTCDVAPQNVGGTCSDGVPATTYDYCDTVGTCIGDVGCPPPSEACVAGSQNRRGCGGARTISRLSAGTGWSIIDDTCSARDDWDLPDGSVCWDANADHTYRLYMREGESVTIRLRTGEPCAWDVSSWRATLKIYQTGGCSSTACASNYAYCEWLETDQTKVWTATQDGWVIIIADGSSAFDDEGAYQLTVSLSCRDGKCGCLP